MQWPKGRAARLGVILIAVSLMLWVGLPTILFLPVETGVKGALAAGQLIVAEVFFWAGAAIAGPEVVRRIRTWRQKPDRQKEGPELDGGASS